MAHGSVEPCPWLEHVTGVGMKARDCVTRLNVNRFVGRERQGTASDFLAMDNLRACHNYTHDPVPRELSKGRVAMFCQEDGYGYVITLDTR